MSKFKVGDRVRIVESSTMDCWAREFLGKEATIVAMCSVYSSSWDLDIVDFASFHENNLQPLVPPDELAWQQFRTHLQPNPAIIFDADPIIVSTDEEAERIADTVPNSHIKVVIRGVVVSEYFGKSQTNRP